MWWFKSCWNEVNTCWPRLVMSVLNWTRFRFDAKLIDDHEVVREFNERFVLVQCKLKSCRPINFTEIRFRWCRLRTVWVHRGRGIRHVNYQWNFLGVMVFGRLEWSALDATLMNSCGFEHKGPREEKRKNKKISQNKKIKNDR